MGKRSAKFDKPVRSENENVIRRENGSVVFRKENVFTDGSRLVEESFMEGSELQNDIEASVPLVAASVYSGTTPGQVVAGGSGAATTKSGKMLKPAYDPDGNIYGVIVMMFFRYGGCGIVCWLLIRIISRIIPNNINDDDDFYGSSIYSVGDDNPWAYRTLRYYSWGY
jgi:hypothetical protein